MIFKTLKATKQQLEKELIIWFNNYHPILLKPLLTFTFTSTAGQPTIIQTSTFPGSILKTYHTFQLRFRYQIWCFRSNCDVIHHKSAKLCVNSLSEFFYLQHRGLNFDWEDCDRLWCLTEVYTWDTVTATQWQRGLGTGGGRELGVVVQAQTHHGSQGWEAQVVYGKRERTGDTLRGPCWPIRGRWRGWQTPVHEVSGPSMSMEYLGHPCPWSIWAIHVNDVSGPSMSMMYLGHPCPWSIWAIHVNDVSGPSMSTMYLGHPCPWSIWAIHVNDVSGPSMSMMYLGHPCPWSIWAIHVNDISGPSMSMKYLGHSCPWSIWAIHVHEVSGPSMDWSSTIECISMGHLANGVCQQGTSELPMGYANMWSLGQSFGVCRSAKHSMGYL